MTSDTRQEGTLRDSLRNGETEDTASVDKVKKARRGLICYFAVLIPLSLLFEGLIFITNNINLTLFLMLTPAFSSLVARLLLREGVKDVSFRLDRRGFIGIAVALLYPVVLGAIAYGVAWGSGLAHFSGNAGSFLVSLLIAMTLGTLNSVLLAAGEEIGWRGYMLTRLIDGHIPQPILLSGIIWVLWHIPLLLGGGDPTLPLTITLFSVSLIANSYLMAHLRLKTGSIWPVIVLHACWNTIIATFDMATINTQAFSWARIMTAIVSLVFILLLWQIRSASRP